MNFKKIWIVLLIFGHVASNGQNKIRWMTWEEAMAKQEKSPRKIFIDVYTEWCTWCKKMDGYTFHQDHIAKYVNENYYPIKFDAEYKNPIEFMGTSYNYVKTFKGGYHELAAFLLQGKLSYPTIVFLDEKNNLIQAIQGFQGPLDFEMIIHFFGEDFHKTTNWRKFTRNYIPIEKNSAPAGLGGKN
jgi:thioredoxin-related protein